MKGSNILEWYIYLVLFRFHYSHLQITFLKKYFGQSVEDDDSCQSVVYRANSFILYYNQLEGNVMKKRHCKDKDSERSATSFIRTPRLEVTPRWSAVNFEPLLFWFSGHIWSTYLSGRIFKLQRWRNEIVKRDASGKIRQRIWNHR